MRGVSRIPGDEIAADGDDLDLGGVGQALWRSRKWIIGATLLGLFGSVAFVLTVKPRYTADARALVENQESYFTRPDRAAAESSVTAPDTEAVASQVQLVTSRDLSREAIKALNLKGNPEFDPAASGPGLLSSLTGLFGGKSESRDVSGEDRIFTNFSDRLYVFPIVKSRVLQIEFSSWDPELAARGANTIAELYIGVQANSKRGNARIAASSLAGLIADLRTRVGEAERKAEEFRASNGLSIGANNLTMNSQQMSDLNAQVTLARTAQADAQAKSRMIRDMLRQGRIAEVPDVANNDLVRRLAEQRVVLRGQIASEGRTLLAGHPRVKELNAQLAELESNIRVAAEKTARTLENEARIAGSRVENLQAAMEQQKKTVGGASGDEARAREFDREARLLKEQLEASTTKYQEALARQAAESTPSDARIISRAVAPLLPTFPKKAPIVAFATLAAFILSAGAVVARELLSGRAYVGAGNSAAGRIEPQLAERAARSGAIGGMIENTDGPEKPEAAVIDMASTRSAVASAAIAESLAGVAGQISRWSRAGSAMRILVTGVDHDSDAAQQAVALARTLSSDRRAVLVELAGDASDANGPLGLSDLLAGRADFGSAIHRDRESSLHLMPAGRGGALIAEGLDTVIDALAHTYEYLIVLAPPVEPGRDIVSGALALAPEVDFAILVCGAKASQPATASACDALRRAGVAHVLSVGEGEPPAGPSDNLHKEAA